MEREKLIIPTASWLHREGGGSSYLLREKDGKRCCLGIYLEDNCGVSPDMLRGGVSSPVLLNRATLETLPTWLVRRGCNMSIAEEMMQVNDDDSPSNEDQVRGEIKRLFAKVDIEVVFVDEMPPTV